MSAPLLTLDTLRMRFAQRPESLIDFADDLAIRFAAFDRAFVPAALKTAAGELLARCPHPSALPLWGVPYIVAANIDVAGIPTSAGLPALDFLADFDAIVVERLRAAGALLVGKTMIDPLGLHASVTDVAAAVAEGLATFGIASGRTGAACVSAAQCGVVSVNPTPGHVVNDGLFAIAPEIDGIVICAFDVAGGRVVRRSLESIDGTSRGRRPPLLTRLGLLGDVTAEGREVARRLGLVAIAVDEVPFAEIAELMNDDAWLVLRLDDIEAALVELPELFPPSLRGRLSRARACSARNFALIQRRLSCLRSRIEAAFADVDLLFIPPETNLTGFISACDLAALALPRVGTLIGPGGSDDLLADAATILAAPDRSRSTRPIDILTPSPLAHP